MVYTGISLFVMEVIDMVVPPTAQGMKRCQGSFSLLPALKYESQTQGSSTGEEAWEVPGARSCSQQGQLQVQTRLLRVSSCQSLRPPKDAQPSGSLCHHLPATFWQQ